MHCPQGLGLVVCSVVTEPILVASARINTLHPKCLQLQTESVAVVLHFVTPPPSPSLTPPPSPSLPGVRDCHVFVFVVDTVFTTLSNTSTRPNLGLKVNLIDRPKW